jgi:alpha-beta hydrolase superfamily lysophospholipase
MGTADFVFTASDGKSIYVRRWLPETRPRATLLIAHGMSEHGERYAELARWLADRSWAVYAPDHRGHGKTANEGERGWFDEHDGFRRVVDDIRELALEISGGLDEAPLFLFGHCLGSLIALAFSGLYGDVLSGCVLEGIIEEPSRSQIAIGKLFSAMGCLVNGQMTSAPFLDSMSFRRKNDDFEPARTAFEWLSRDRDAVDAYAADPLCGFVCSYGFFRDLFKGFDLVFGPAGVMRDIPPSLAFYIVAGDRDPMGGSRGAVGRLAGRLRAAGVERVDERLYPGARHELLNETNRDEVIRDVEEWMKTAVESREGADGRDIRIR